MKQAYTCTLTNLRLVHKEACTPNVPYTPSLHLRCTVKVQRCKKEDVKKEIRGKRSAVGRLGAAKMREASRDETQGTCAISFTL